MGNLKSGNRKTDDLTGKVFDKWTVLERDSRKHSCARWICKCECGTEKAVSSSHLRYGRSRSCRKCVVFRHKNKLNSNILSQIRYGAKSRKIDFDLGSLKEMSDFLFSLLNKQNNLCAISGLSIFVARTIGEHKARKTTASLDRIDSSKGYNKDNVQWVHKDVNKMKNNFDQETFIKLCKEISQNNS